MMNFTNLDYMGALRRFFLGASPNEIAFTKNLNREQGTINRNLKYKTIPSNVQKNATEQYYDDVTQIGIAVIIILFVVTIFKS